MARNISKKKAYNFLNGEDVKLPVTGTFETGEMTMDYETSIMVLAAYDANDNIVVPTAGTATFAVEQIDGSWITSPSSGDASVDMTKTGPEVNYENPVFIGPCQNARITLSGVSGASYVKAFCWRL